jgi:hypothetical protein
MAQREAEAPKGDYLSRRDFLKVVGTLFGGGALATAGFFGLDALFNEGRISKEVIFAVQTAWENATKKTQGGVDTGAIATETATEEFRREFTVTAVEAGVDTPTITATLENTAMPTFTPTKTPAPTETPTPTEEPIREFPRASIESFKECTITKEDLPDYFNWLQNVIAPTLVPIFKARHEQGAMQTDLSMVEYSHGNTTFLAYPSAASFKDENSRPFMRDVTFAYMPAEWITQEMKDAGAVATGYMIRPMFFYDYKTETVHAVVTLSLSNYDHAGKTAEQITIYTQEMNEPILANQPKYAAGHVDSVVDAAFNTVNRSGRNMESRFVDFAGGDYSALSHEDLVLLTFGLRGDANWFNN